MFNKFLDDYALIDLGYSSYVYTWNNICMGKVNIQIRLDRGLANSTWRLMFPKAEITHLTAISSDHRPLLLHITSQEILCTEPFKFEKMWIMDESSSLWYKNLGGRCQLVLLCSNLQQNEVY